MDGGFYLRALVLHPEVNTDKRAGTDHIGTGVV